MKKLRRKLSSVSRNFSLAAALFLMVACSSAPKRPAEIFSIQSMIETQIGRANKEADQGNYAESLDLLAEAWRLAVMTDRPALRIRVNLSRANALYALDRTAEAEKIWRDAEIESEFSGEPILASASRVYRARSLLISGRADPKEVLALVEKEEGNLKSDKLLAAMGWTVKGLAEKELDLYGEAEKSIREALSTHDKGRYLEQAGYDWYLIASIRSVSGNYGGAMEALNQALEFDRRAENSFGLAMDWAAIGDVFRKMDQEEAAAMSWHRSAEILRAMDKAAQAREVESRIKSRRQDPGTKNKPQ